jgi:hypothetical protein
LKLNSPFYYFTGEIVEMIVIETDLKGDLELVARGKVRDIYKVDDKHLLLVSTDRISAFDVVLNNVNYINISNQ